MLSLVGWKPVEVPKSSEELKRIREAVKANILFDRLNNEQREQVYRCVERVKVSARHGDTGRRATSSTRRPGHVVTIGPDGNNSPEILKYEPQWWCQPMLWRACIALPGANVVARTDGLLWALDRKTFHAILARSEAALVSALRGVHVFRGLSTSHATSRLTPHRGELRTWRDSDSGGRSGLPSSS